MTLFRAVSFVFGACAVAVLAAQPRDMSAAQIKGTARVHGRVVAADTGAAVRGAMVTLTTTSGLRVVATTDDQGEFDFRDLPSSGISLKVAKAGFVENSVPMVVQLQPLKDGQTVNRGDVRIVRGAVIAGRVLDASGEPVSGATVNALRVAYPEPGNRRLVPARSAVETNDLGDYRLYGLAPGTYYVTASAQPMDLTFYPGTPHFTGAQPIIVQGGDQALGMDMRLLSVRLTSLSGRAVDSRGQPLVGLVVELKPVRADGFRAGRTAIVDVSGRFTMASVVPGEYRLEVSTNYAFGREIRVVGEPEPLRTQIIRSSPEVPETASVPVTVVAGTELISDILIQTRVGSELRGRVLVDGGIPSAEALVDFRIEASSFDRHGAGTVGAVRSDGTFAFRGLMGRIRILTSGVPRRSTFHRVVANGMDVTDDGVDMDRGNIIGAEVHMTTKPTVVKGQVTDAEGKPVPARVIVYAENPALWSKPYTRHVVSKPSMPGAGFEIAGLPAGRYVAVAVETVVPDQWADPENLQRLRPFATPFTLAEGETTTLALRRR